MAPGRTVHLIFNDGLARASAHELGAMRVEPVSRRQAVALALALPVLAPLKAFALLGIGESQPTVREVDTAAGFICQARLRDQDFAVVRYTGSFANGTAFDTRYTEQPLTFELGSFYLPGVDEALEGACVGSKLRLSWNNNSPPPLSAEDAPLLPAGSSVVLDFEILSIKYQLFGEKMRLPQQKQETIDYMFAPESLSLQSPVDKRGHQKADQLPLVKTDNPFAVAPNKVSLITNPGNTLAPLWEGIRKEFNF